MWQDEILEELHRIRDEHAKSFNYDMNAICEDWRRKQAESGRQLVTLTPGKQSNNAVQPTEQK
ncbi:hypothetical protein [Argonema antarcticum]|uniref:hypothetical protein n=1 Tax=Argonema antarcticum TaxID=2942763 RepID=UPI002012C28E|nr:hypothetical protein [Argonema antarcticum]MCL1472190.1 hypothetical protein [Argonema antarcticum A004/B2]